MKKKIIIKGHVQGVFYRENTKKLAKALGLKGYVKNKFDGSVKIVVSGEENKIKKLIKWCKHGPMHATVENVEVKEHDKIIDEKKEFQITH
ncbi:acylphosphatase [Candidatus Woesearchaeota archaeon]|jgi:acylphosphatase|nr:acylphosphatase [Candidatus Woesearchaeota archaeon]MBT5271950.1 acylphosphatase [Candidatus Woesearchaeota archaeon]MBT6041062.1 acylphosphatase [Candidatus Woesearchaeota archaeon]MBT6336238.1 acylphosphatase [Candidatus Woesearchaeota archaeon]MBT7927995.1 acylphosphatase [Candidatus Woesearchaeota archaeon]